MKTCPVCDKTFDDSMRFCQTDGTPLVDTIEESPDDPFKTMVAPQGGMPSPVEPPDDPFKTMVAGSMPKPESGDLLQLPEEYDPMKTSVVSQDDMRAQLGSKSSSQDAAGSSAPPSPFGSGDSSPLELDLGDGRSDSSSAPTELPKFSEPSLDPPDFGNMSSGAAPTPKNEPFSSDSNPVSPKPDSFGGSPFDRQDNSAIPSPFGDQPQAYERPSAPPYKESEPPTVLGANPFDQPAPFGRQEPVGQPFNPPAQQNDWAAASAPVSNWQNQNVGQNNPGQPPAMAAGQGQNQTLPIISLVLGIISICCPIAILTGPAALITGFLGMKNVNADPSRYAGKGLAVAGMIVGGVFFLLSVIWWILRVLGLAYMSFNY